MSQFFTISNRTRTMNVPCTGRFNIVVEDDGFFEISLSHVDGQVYVRTRGTMSPAGTFHDRWVGDPIVIPEWMWNSICDTMNEMKLELERDALDTPQLKETWV